MFKGFFLSSIGFFSFFWFFLFRRCVWCTQIKNIETGTLVWKAYKKYKILNMVYLIQQSPERACQCFSTLQILCSFVQKKKSLYLCTFVQTVHTDISIQKCKVFVFIRNPKQRMMCVADDQYFHHSICWREKTRNVTITVQERHVSPSKQECSISVLLKSLFCLFVLCVLIATDPQSMI